MMKSFLFAYNLYIIQRVFYPWLSARDPPLHILFTIGSSIGSFICFLQVFFNFNGGLLLIFGSPTVTWMI